MELLWAEEITQPFEFTTSFKNVTSEKPAQ